MESTDTRIIPWGELIDVGSQTYVAKLYPRFEGGGGDGVTGAVCKFEGAMRAEG
jgi:hypothetical protein